MKLRFIYTFFIIAFATTAFAQGPLSLPDLNRKYTSGLFRDEHAYMIAPEQDVAATSSLSVFQYLQGRVPGLQVYGSTFQPYAVFIRGGRPAFFLDEMRIDMRTLANINMTDIAFVKVFRGPFYGGFGGGNGAIAVYTKDGDEEGEEEEEEKGKEEKN